MVRRDIADEENSWGSWGLELCHSIYDIIAGRKYIIISMPHMMMHYDPNSNGKRGYSFLIDKSPDSSIIQLFTTKLFLCETQNW